MGYSYSVGNTVGLNAHGLAIIKGELDAKTIQCPMPETVEGEVIGYDLAGFTNVKLSISRLNNDGKATLIWRFLESEIEFIR